MGYYKLIVDGKITDVMKDPVWVKQNHAGRTIRCDVKDACGLLSHDEEQIFQIDGAKSVFEDCDVVKVADITEDEYNELKTVLELDGTISDQTVSFEWPKEPKPVEETNANLVSVIERKIELMRADCQAAIEAGVDVKLESGETKHFGLTIEDQLNLQNAQHQINYNTTKITYKASGEPLSFYSYVDIQTIACAASDHIVQQRAYFESLRNWIRDTESIVEAGNHIYGEDVPEEYWSEMYRQIKS